VRKADAGGRVKLRTVSSFYSKSFKNDDLSAMLLSDANFHDNEINVDLYSRVGRASATVPGTSGKRFGLGATGFFEFKRPGMRIRSEGIRFADADVLIQRRRSSRVCQ
jgi:hypothetical protein